MENKKKIFAEVVERLKNSTNAIKIVENKGHDEMLHIYVIVEDVSKVTPQMLLDAVGNFEEDVQIIIPTTKVHFKNGSVVGTPNTDTIEVALCLVWCRVKVKRNMENKKRIFTEVVEKLKKSTNAIEVIENNGHEDMLFVHIIVEDVTKVTSQMLLDAVGNFEEDIQLNIPATKVRFKNGNVVKTPNINIIEVALCLVWLIENWQRLDAVGNFEEDIQLIIPTKEKI